MNFENDELDDFFEELNFKPITKGLGFHHSLKEKSDVRTSIKTRSLDLKKDFAKRQLESSRVSKKNLGKKEVNMGELSAFYSEPEVNEVNINIVDEVDEAPVVAMLSRFSAWAIDMMIILSMQLILIVAVIFTAKLPMKTFDSLMLLDGILESFTILTTMFYVFYFTFFDKTNFSSPGKNLLGLKIIGETSNKVTLAQSFMRALISLLSMTLIGLVSILGLTDSLTETKVIRK